MSEPEERDFAKECREWKRKYNKLHKAASDYIFAAMDDHRENIDPEWRVLRETVFPQSVFHQKKKGA